MASRDKSPGRINRNGPYENTDSRSPDTIHETLLARPDSEYLTLHSTTDSTASRQIGQTVHSRAHLAAQRLPIRTAPR
jgi:hypothetical protein